MPSADVLFLHGEAQEAFHEKAANAARARFGRNVFVRGVVEVSNYCRENCAYCGMRRSNRTLARYRADHERLAELLIHHRPASMTDVNIQAGEDPVAVREVVLPLIQTLRRETDLGISVCLGSLSHSLYSELKQAGTEIYIIKFEIADPKLYAKLESPGKFDERIANAPDVRTLACGAGCFWCCYFTVDVRAIEAFAILQFMEEHLTPAEQARIRQEIEANSALVQALSAEERAQRNIKCPFLAVGRCTIYAARPQTCRNYHATSATGCKQSFDEPGNLDIDPEFAPLVYQSGGAHVDAFTQAMQDAGHDTDVYELSTALLAAMHDISSARQRFDAGQTPFPDLEGDDVPLEFMEREDAD